MTLYVIDASVVVKWVFHEEFRLEALRFLHPNIIRFAPDLVLHECAGAIQKKVIRKEISEETGWANFEVVLYKTPLKLIASQALIRHAYSLANLLGHAIYDCYYLAFAEERNAKLVTADRKFFNRVQTSVFAHRITWVEKPPVISAVDI